MPPVAPDRYAVIIPACNEEQALPLVLAELRALLDPDRFELVVGVNGSTDRTAQIARENGALVAETARRGYGHGCQAAIARVDAGERVPVDGYLFFAADGANDPRDIALLVNRYREQQGGMVLGCRTRKITNWSIMNFHYVMANRLFGLLCGLLTGRFFADLGPLRLIERNLFHRMQLCEWTYGWTIEAQIRAALLKARIVEVPVRERSRIAGEQKVSRVSWQRSLGVGLQIIAAGFRSRFRAL
ncbi:MAG: glycosyltransferase family 2 protein [Verrucomicrobiota bacterium]